MLAKLLTSFNLRHFSKRVVRDHLIEEKFKRMLVKPDPKENTSEAETDPEDFEDYRSKILNKAKIPIKKYDKKIDKDEADLKDQEYFKLAKDFEKTVDDYLKNENLKIDPLNEQRKDKTRRLVRSLKVNSTFDYVREKNLNKVVEEYNNYSKFQRNYSYYKENTKNEFLDDGEMNLAVKITDYISRLTPQGEVENGLMETVRSADSKGASVPQDLIDAAYQEEEALDHQILQEEEPFAEDSETKMGRMSPHAKEDIYDLYNNGWSVKDISLKYGILPARVKAIVWCKRYFYDEVAPNFDRTFWRLGLEREFAYAADYSFVDYGIDLQTMAAFEKGLPSLKFGETHIDINPPPEVIEKVKNAVGRLPKRKAYTIVRETIGTGTRAYKIKDILIRKGNGKLDVSEMFKRICYRGDLTPYSFPKKVRKSLEKGPRVASLGYRVGPRSNMPLRFYNRFYHSQ